MPAVFHENLFDDLFDPFWNDGALERAMNREERETFGKRGANMMKTDVKQTENGYDVAVDLPGCKKEDVQMDLNDGYLTIQAVRSHSNDEKDNNGRYIRRETFSGTCARSFYVGDAVKKEDIHASSRMASCTSSCLHPSSRKLCLQTPIGLKLNNCRVLVRGASAHCIAKPLRADCPQGLFASDAATLPPVLAMA